VYHSCIQVSHPPGLSLQSVEAQFATVLKGHGFKACPERSRRVTQSAKNGRGL
jgi:hypothetical protein